MKYINFLNKTKYYFIFLAIGVLLFFNKMFISGFDIIPGGYNGIYNNYVLEHYFLWISGIHDSFWSAPFNYYDAHSIAQSDSLMGYIPLYCILRIFIKNPFSAFQLLFIALCILNYSCFYYLLKILRFKPCASSVGAFVFAFSVLRYFNFDNVSYFSQFLSVLSIICLLKVKKQNKSIINHIYFTFFCIFLVLQFYTSYALGFFLVFSSVFVILLSLLPKNSRDIVLGYIKNFYKYILFYIFVLFILLIPMAYQFVCLDYVNLLSSILSKISNYTVWLRSLSVLDNICKFNFDYIGINSHLASASLGIFTTLFSICAFYKTPKAKGPALFALLFIFLISSGYSAIHFWGLFYYFSIGIESLESILSVSFIALLIISIGIALFLENTKNKIILFASILIIIIEQIAYNNDPNSYLKINFISKKNFVSSLNNLRTDDKYVYVKPVSKNSEYYGQNDIEYKNIQAEKVASVSAMWLGIKLGKPVLNNYFNKSKPQKEFKARTINLVVDYNQI